jgi:ATP-dependent Zn protease
VLLGGWAAEKETCGPEKISTGPSNDIEHANRLANSIVKKYGMGEQLGLVRPTSRSAEKTLVMADNDVKKLLEQAARSATICIQDHRSAFEQLVNTLLDRESLEESEIREILSR